MNIWQRKRRADITTGIALLRGVPGIRTISKAKVDESRILPHTREGLAKHTSYQDQLRQQNEDLSDLKLFLNKTKSSVKVKTLFLRNLYGNCIVASCIKYKMYNQL